MPPASAWSDTISADLRAILRKSPASESSDTRLSALECDTFAEQFVDRLLSPEGAWFRKMYLVGLQDPVRLKSFMKGIGLSTKSFSPSFVKRLHGALQRKDRKALLSLWKSICDQDPPSRGFPEAFLRLSRKRAWRGAMLQIADKLKGEPGFERKIKPEEYGSVASLGEELAPVILKLLKELESGTCRTVRELLEFWSKDKPRECEFLIRHIDRLDSVMRDETLLNRAKRLPARARLIADAMAGAEYGLSLRTSIERAREGRRQTQLHT